MAIPSCLEVLGRKLIIKSLMFNIAVVFKLAQDPEISPGDFVYISTDKLQRNRLTPKLDFKWTGPYPVKSVYEGAATLDLPPGSKIPSAIRQALPREEH